MQIKFKNCEVPIQTCKIGTVVMVDNADSKFNKSKYDQLYGHIMSFISVSSDDLIIKIQLESLNISPNVKKFHAEDLILVGY